MDYIACYLAEHRRPPLIREIQAGCQIASYKSVMDRLVALERKGYIRREPYKHRSVQLVHPQAALSEQPAFSQLADNQSFGEGAA